MAADDAMENVYVLFERLFAYLNKLKNQIQAANIHIDFFNPVFVAIKRSSNIYLSVIQLLRMIED